MYKMEFLNGNNIYRTETCVLEKNEQKKSMNFHTNYVLTCQTGVEMEETSEAWKNKKLSETKTERLINLWMDQT